jgi:hypothetical protein
MDGAIHGEAGVCPLDHALGQSLVQELAFQEECDEPLAEARAHPGQIDDRDVDESALSVEASLQEQAVPVGVPSGEFLRTLEYDDRAAEDCFSGCCYCKIPHQPIDEAADLAVKPAIVAEEDAEHLGNGEDELSVGQAQQKLFFRVFAEQEGAFPAAGRAEVEDLRQSRTGSPWRISFCSSRHCETFRR